MYDHYLAIDIGASSGRHMLGHLEEGRLVLEEVYRFPNSMKEKGGHKVWDVDALFSEIIAGMKKCAELGKVPVSMGIDTWAVDYVLIDGCGKRLGDAFGYRDSRTDGMDEKVYEVISEKDLYARTGIQKQKFNTIYQLMADKVQNEGILERADKMLMIPDYFGYLLTGRMAAEYTNATTTQLVDPVSKDWDRELINLLGYPEKIFPDIALPGTVLGDLKEEIAKEAGYSCSFTLPPTHDTASAVAAVPALSDDVLYISSGTWSLMGTELTKADMREEARACNYTNEGGVDYRFRFLKNIMGMWMIQCVKAESKLELSYGEIAAMACKNRISSVVDCNDERFLAPACMTKEIQNACRETGQRVPEGLIQTARVIYNSLAESYGKTCREIESLTGKTYETINIVGGGGNAELLNKLTARTAGKKVAAGPTEATAIGNIITQMRAAGLFKDLKEARKCVADSFPVKIYE